MLVKLWMCSSGSMLVTLYRFIGRGVLGGEVLEVQWRLLLSWIHKVRPPEVKVTYGLISVSQG